MLNFVNIVLSRYKLEDSTFKIIHSTSSSVAKKAWELREFVGPSRYFRHSFSIDFQLGFARFLF